MATWNSKLTTKYDEYMGMTYRPVELTWTYGTGSDTLSLHYKKGEYDDFSHHPAEEVIKHISQEEAKALLEQLANWCYVFQGKDTLNNIIEKAKKS